MKLKTLSVALMTAGMLAACSSDEPMQQTTGNATDVAGDATGYLALDINLPSRTGTRADAVTLEDGLQTEYAVKDATLLVFVSDNTDNQYGYTFLEASQLDNMAPWNTEAGQDVTVSATRVAKLTKVSVNDSKEYYAFVMLNNGTANMALPKANQKFGDWLGTAQSATATTNAGSLYMASAPLLVNGKVVPLAKIDKSAIAATASTAVETGVKVFVERGVAKVEIGAASFDTKNVATSGSSDDVYAGHKVQLKNWNLQIVNKTAFPARNVNGLSASGFDIWKNARFISGNLQYDANTVANRLEWALDPNYNGFNASDFDMTVDYSLDKSKNVKYVTENTFSIANQNQDQTTRVIFKGNYSIDGTNFNVNFYKIGTQPKLYSAADLQTLVSAVAKKVLGKDVKYLLSDDQKNKRGVHAVTAANFANTDNSKLADAEAANLITNLGMGNGLDTYLNGEVFYVARIRHFNDEQTPWKAGDPTYESDLKHLGRYGVVRNNWYSVTVNNIYNPGWSDTPEPPTGTPDDENDMYMNIKVQILPWSKRVQNVDFE